MHTIFPLINHSLILRIWAHRFDCIVCRFSICEIAPTNTRFSRIRVGISWFNRAENIDCTAAPFRNGARSNEIVNVIRCYIPIMTHLHVMVLLEIIIILRQQMCNKTEPSPIQRCQFTAISPKRNPFDWKTFSGPRSRSNTNLPKNSNIFRFDLFASNQFRALARNSNFDTFDDCWTDIGAEIRTR